jgi:hypothetical protein
LTGERIVPLDHSPSLSDLLYRIDSAEAELRALVLENIRVRGRSYDIVQRIGERHERQKG